MWGPLPELDTALCGHVTAQICDLFNQSFSVVRGYDDKFLYLVNFFIMLIKLCYLLLC
jgi:hypothetical protein